MTALIYPGSRTARVGMKIAKMQGLEGEDIILFANALTAEYMSDDLTPSDAALMVDAMEDFDLKPSSSPVIKEIRLKNGYYFNVLDFDSDYGICTNEDNHMSLEGAIENNKEWNHVIHDYLTFSYIYRETEKMKALLPDTEKEKDDFIVGKCYTEKKRHSIYGTHITSEEVLPKEFDGAEVEIRLKKIEKPPFKKVYKGVGRMLTNPQTYNSFVAVDSGRCIGDRTDYLILTDAERELKGKNIRVTIEEVQ